MEFSKCDLIQRGEWKKTAEVYEVSGDGTVRNYANFIGKFRGCNARMICLLLFVAFCERGLIVEKVRKKELRKIGSGKKKFGEVFGKK
jgi:hypothetical protein